ncbi:hypothetical protein APX70_05665, partial [Pseudomonas syringae pv. maculicola]
TQAGTGNVTFRQGRTEKSSFQRRNRAVCEPLHSGQISHGRLVWESVWESLVRRRGVRRLAVKSLLLKVITKKTVTKFLQLMRQLPTHKKAPITGLSRTRAIYEAGGLYQ